MARIGIIVDFTIKPDHAGAFEALIRDHAARTLAEEPGCERFDVMPVVSAPGKPEPGRVMLCEIYRDPDAYAAHGANPRLATVRATYAPWVERRSLTLCELT